jgi:hypothetical protein
MILERALIILAHVVRWVKLEWYCISRAIAERVYPYLSRAIALREVRFTGSPLGDWIDLEAQAPNGLIPHLLRLELNNMSCRFRPLLGGPSVKELSIGRCGLTTEYINQLLSSMPNLCELHLDDTLFFPSDGAPVLQSGSLSGIKSLKFSHQTLYTAEAMLFLHIMKGAACSLERLSFHAERVHVDHSSRSMSHISEAFDHIPPTLKAVKIVFGSGALIRDEIHTVEKKLRAKVQDLIVLTLAGSVRMHHASSGEADL